MPFPEVAAADDSRAPLSERYENADAYLAAVKAAADQLVAEGFMLAGDVDDVMERAKADARMLD